MVVMGSGPGVLVGAPGEDLLRAFGNDPEGVWQGEWWRLLGGAFLHANELHLAMNVYGLWVVGYLLEPALGTIRLVALYMGSAVLGGAVSVVFGGEFGVGASGALFGWVGALLSNTILEPDREAGLDMMRRLIWVIVLNLGLGVVVNEYSSSVRIDNYAHLGGLLGGLLLGIGLLGARYRGALSAWAIGGTALFGVVLAVALGSATHPKDNAHYDAALGEGALRDRDVEAARRHLEAALRTDRHNAYALILNHRICVKQDDHVCARAALTALLSLEPLPLSGTSSVDGGKLLRVLRRRAKLAMDANDWELAAALLGRGSELQPDDGGLANDHAWCILQSRMVTDADRALALEQAGRARRMTNAESSAINHTFAEALHQSGHTDQAIEVLEDLRRRMASSWWSSRLASLGGLPDEKILSEIARMRAGKAAE